MTNRRCPAEWEAAPPVILMALPTPESDWAYMLDEALECYRNMIDAIAPYAKVAVLTPSAEYAREMIGAIVDSHPGTVVPVVATYNDTWTRDYGAITVEEQPDGDGPRQLLLLDFTFNAWGMKFAACHDNRVNGTLKEKHFYTAPLLSCKETVLEGGSIDSDGCGVILVTSECLLSDNRNHPAGDRQRAEQMLRQRLGAKKVLWLDHGYLAGDDTDSHVDTLARFAPHRQIVYVHCQDPEDEHFEELDAMRRQLLEFTDLHGMPYNTIGLPMPDPIYDGEGNRLPATYANFLVLPDVVVMPSYGQPRPDRLAAQMLEMAYERPVVAVDCRALVQQHGSLHCSTMQFFENTTAI